MADRGRLGHVALLAAAAAGAVVAVRASVGWPFAAVVLLYVLGFALEMPNPSGRDATLVLGVAAGVVLVGQSPVVHVLAAGGVALPGGWLVVRLIRGERGAAAVFPAEPVGMLVFGLSLAAALPAMGDIDGPVGLTVVGLAAAAWFATSVVVRALAEPEPAARRLLLIRGLGDWPAYVALFSSGALYAVTVEPMGVWAVPLAGLPYVFGHVSLLRVQTTGRTYRQTIEALGAIPEAGGLVSPGHSARVAELAVGVGADLGLSSAGLRRLEYAALLHDVGRVVLANPSVAAGEYSLSDVSGWSAAIMSEARYLENVASLVAAQHHPYRRPGEVRDPGLPRAAQILRACASYDGQVTEGLTPLEAIETLHRGAAYDYDPEVVAALRRVLERREAIAA